MSNNNNNNTQWEVVTKSKKSKNFEKKVEAHKEKKREAALRPKLEEILPSHQYQKIITGRIGKENVSPAKSSSNKSKVSTPKKSSSAKGKEQTQETTSKKSGTTKQASKPKSLEQAFKNLTVEEFASNLEKFKLLYPDSKLAWLKGVASYLNTQLPFECDPTFSGKSILYPSILAPTAFKKAIVDFLSLEGESTLEYFFHYTLMESMCTELNNNLPVVGYKFLLQIIAQNWPQICSHNMANTAMLRHSYQNRSNICLSILWAIGQGGYQNLMEGIKVWQNLMVPNLEMKSYTKFVSEYIEKVLNSALDQSLNLNQNEFFAIYNVLKKHHTTIPRECNLSLTRSSELFLQKFIASSTKHANLFLTLLRDIDSPTKNGIELNGCLSCLLHGGEDCFKVWKMNYKKQLTPTVYLLKKIETEICDSASSLAMSSSFHDFLIEAEQLNAELDSAKKRDPNVDTLIPLVKSVQDKTAQQKKKQISEKQKKKCSGCCKWTLGSIVLIALIAGVLIYDTEVNGKGVFAKSATGNVLKNAGVLPHVEKAWYATMSTAARGYKWAEKNLPPYTKPVCELVCNVTKLARNFACNAFTILKDLINAKLPVAAQFLEQYVPGLPKKIENTADTVKTVSVDTYGKLAAFFKAQVLVGRFSPENLSKALNETQNLAKDYFNQFNKKVDAYAKLK